MMTWQVPLFKIYWDEDDVKNVTSVIRSGQQWADGTIIKEFEQELAEYLGLKYCVTFNSGTSALHAALLAHGIKNGDEVIVPSFTFIATSNACLFVGAKPRFADIEDKHFGLDPESVNEQITRKTRALIPVHYAGGPCKIKELQEIATDHDLILIEDACESLGSTIDGQFLGTFGDSAILSFCQNKVISTGEGGAVVTDSKELHDRLVEIRSHGRPSRSSNYFQSAKSADYVSLGYNFRMPTMNAALGRSQLGKIESIITMRIKVAQKYLEMLKDIHAIQLPMSSPSIRHVHQLFSIRILDDERQEMESRLNKKSNLRDELKQYLATHGIMSKVYFDPIHLTTFYRDTLKYQVELPNTEKISQQILSLPIWPNMPQDDQQQVINAITTFFKERE